MEDFKSIDENRQGSRGRTHNNLHGEQAEDRPVVKTKTKWRDGDGQVWTEISECSFLLVLICDKYPSLLHFLKPRLTRIIGFRCSHHEHNHK